MADLEHTDKVDAKLALWEAMRKYIESAINLGMVRSRVLHSSVSDRAALEDQAIRREAEVRRLMEAL